jgi:hypothetical protein
MPSNVAASSGHDAAQNDQYARLIRLDLRREASFIEKSAPTVLEAHAVFFRQISDAGADKREDAREWA